jgi:hypothetical protein
MKGEMNFMGKTCICIVNCIVVGVVKVSGFSFWCSSYDFGKNERILFAFAFVALPKWARRIKCCKYIYSYIEEINEG